MPSGPSGGGLLGRTFLKKGDRTGNTWTLQRLAPFFFPAQTAWNTQPPVCIEHAQDILFKSGDGTQAELTR